MALYTETSYDDWARRQRQSLQNSAQNLQNKQAGLQAAQNAKQKTTLESALSGLVGGLKERGSDILNTAKNIGKTVVGSINQIGANKSIENAQKDDSKRRNEIAKRYGFNSYSEAINSGKVGDDFWNEIKNNNKQTKEKLEQNKARQGSFGDVTKINTNEAKGQALNTIDSVLGLLPGGAGAVANVAGGGISGIGDEYKRAGREGDSVNWTNARNNAIVGAASGVAGMAGGNALGKLGAKGGANGLTKLATSQLGRGIASGAAAGAVGGGLGTYLNGGSLEDALLAAKEGAKAGGIGGGVMAGTMGLGGKALDKFRNRGGNAPIPEAEPMEAMTVQKNRIEQPTEQRIEAEAPSTRRGIAVTDLDAGAQDVRVRNGRPTESRGKYIDSVVRRSDANLPEARVNLADRFKNNFDDSLDSLIKNGEFGEGADILTALKASGVQQPELAAIKSGAQEWAEINNPFATYGMRSRQDLPILDRQEYYYDKSGKVGKQGNGNLTSEDVPSYMQDRLRNDAGRVANKRFDNESIMREVFGDNMDKEDMYRIYEELAATPQGRTYDAVSINYALESNPQLNTRVQQSLLDQFNPARKISIEKALSQAETVPIEDMTTNYRKSTIPARQYEQAINTTPEAEIVTPSANRATATQEPEIDYNTQIQRQKAQIQADKARRDAIGGVMSQYGTTRLSDRIEGLPEAAWDMAKLGFTDRAEIDNYASKITGKDGEMSKIIRNSLNKAGNTDANLGISMDEVFAAAGAEQAAQKKIQSFFDAQSKKYRTDNGQMARSDMYDFGKTLEKEGYKKYDRGVRNQNTTDQAYGEALIELSKAAIQKATDGVDVSGNIDLKKLISIAPDNPEHVARMENLAKNAKTVQDIRNAMANATKMSLLKQAEEYNMNTYGQNVGGKGKAAIKTARSFLTGNPVPALEAAAEAAMTSSKAQQKAIKKSVNMANKYQAQANGEAPIKASRGGAIKDRLASLKDNGLVQNAKNLASGAAERIGNATAGLNNETLANTRLNDGLTLGAYMTNQANRQIGAEQARDAVERMNNAQAVQAAQADYDNALASYQNEEQQVNNAIAMAQQAQSTSQLNRIANAMELALNAGDINAYSQLADLYTQAAKIEELKNPTAKTDGKALSANQAKALTAQQQLDMLATMRPNAATVAANIPGLNKIVDLAGGNEYDNQADALATTLGYLLSGANIKESEAKRIGKAYVPTAFDSEAVRQQKLDRAAQLIQSYMSDTGALAA